MIEAVNSVIANASLLRGNAEQVDSARSFAVDPERAQQTPSVPKAPYISPYISLDLNYNKAVLQIRDSETGDIIRQFPTETRLKSQSAQQIARPSFETRGNEVEVNEAASAPVPESGSTNVALAQVASAALASGAQSGVQNLSAGVSVFA